MEPGTQLPDDRSPVRRALIGLAVVAAVGLVGGYGVAVRSKPRAVTVAARTPEAARPSGRMVFVHVAGAVQKPGLYRLPSGSRIDDAIRAAGGVTSEGNLDALNLAAQVRDGDKVLVPGQAAAAPPGGAPGAGAVSGAGPPGASGMVNLNTATAAELDALPGIGPAIAARIIAYRDQHGGFRTVKDLMKVPGIGPAKFEQLQTLVTV